jgi:hypothetical protein
MSKELFLKGTEAQRVHLAKVNGDYQRYVDNELLSPHTTVIAVDGCAVPPTTLVAEDGQFLTGKWVSRAEPVIAKDGAAFWVVDEKGEVHLSEWVGREFVDLDSHPYVHAVTFYQPIHKPEAPTI